jgi:hypothetical protein
MSPEPLIRLTLKTWESAPSDFLDMCTNFPTALGGCVIKKDELTMLKVMGNVLRFLLLVSSRAIFICSGVAALAAAWGYYGYERISCHPMFSPSKAECDSVQVIAAEHAMSMVRTLAPLQTMVRDQQVEIVFTFGAVLAWAVSIELIFGVAGVVKRRRERRDMFKRAKNLQLDVKK